MASTSNPSKAVHSIRIPKPSQNFKANFVYNFYVTDESIQEDPVVPDAYKKRTIDKNDVNLSNFSLRIPRYVELSWDIPKSANAIKLNLEEGIEANKDKINSEDDLLTSKYTPFAFSNYGAIQNAAYDIKSDTAGLPMTELGMSQATIIDKFVTELLEKYDESDEKNNIEKIRNDIKNAISSIEKFADQPNELLGYKFFNEKNEPLKNVTAFQKLNTNINLNTQLRGSVLVDLFASSTLPQKTIDTLNNAYSKFSDDNAEEDDVPKLKAVATTQSNSLPIPDASRTSSIIGYIIDRYEFENNSYTKDKTIYVENPLINNILDINVKYGATYYYAIRTVSRLEITTVDDDKSKKSIFYIAGKSSSTHVKCEEDVAPPEPDGINFIWDYKENKFYVTWSLPFNAQKDIKQFQIFRRASINEPFELLQQHCFDFSNVKRTSGEIIDGNKPDMTEEQKSFVKYMSSPSYRYRDDEFIVDSEMLISSKYIYAIASIDAHGYISNYSAQFEVTFDFFKNQLVKKLISNAGAPRPYPNLLLNADLFKDTIMTSGMSSQKMKIYFMPEYFKVRYNSGKIQKLVATTRDGGYYKMQFINTQNQKMDELTIKVEDPKNLISS